MARRYYPSITTAVRTANTPQEREYLYDTDENRPYAGDGSTVGAKALAYWTEPATAFANGDATPSVADGHEFVTTGTTAITNFDDGTANQVITIYRGDSDIVITDNANIDPIISGNITLSATRPSASFRLVSGVWKEVAQAGLVSTAMTPVVQAASLGSARDLLGISPLDVRPEAYGAEGDGVTNDTTAVNDAIAAAAALGAHARVYLYASYLVTSITNTYGVEFYGPGKIVKAITGGNQQLNSYADEGNRIFIGKEYLTRAFQFLAGGQGSPTYTLDCFIYGDSTVEGGYGEGSLGVEDVLRLFAAARGIPNISFTNRGAANTSVDDINAIPDLGADTGLIFIKYGINDAADGLATFTTNLRTELAAIRADSDGAEGSLSIVLVGPNSTNDTPNGRDEEWYEQLRGVYVQAARDYKCAFFDTYAFMRDSRSAAGKWLDNPYSDGRGIHPLGNGNLWIWGAVFDACFSDSDVVAWKTNKLINHGATTRTLSASAAPSAFAQCAVSIDRATVANGFPYEGSVVTFWSVDSPALQVLYPFAQYNTRITTRTAYVTGDSWNRWTGVKENLTLGYNSWVDAALGAGFPAPGAFVDVSGVVHLVGGVKSGTTTAGTQIAQLPSGMAPAYNQLFPVAANGGIVQIKVQTNGGIYLQTTGDATFTMLDGISFLSV